MSDQDELYEKSWILYHILDRFIGNREKVAALRRLTVIQDKLGRFTENAPCECEPFTTGSLSEGIRFKGSDVDTMYIDKYAIVMCPDKDISSEIDRTNKSVLMMREAGGRPGYVHLELLQRGQKIHPRLWKSLVPVGDVFFVSSEIYRQEFSCTMNQPNMEIHGPAITIKGSEVTNFIDLDKVSSFPCYNWPSEANEWVGRPRNWPDKALRDQIINGGCQLVPVGDKTSADPFLQWRISFVSAERKLIHSLTHVQFLVYGLLKYFLKQISGTLEQMLGAADILSSYIMKTIVFYAVESTTESFWQEKHTFLCFMFCLKILVIWVKVGHCPNYFIKNNNMFLGKVHGENQRKLLYFLTYLHHMNWGCLSFGTFIQPSIGERIRNVRKGELEYVLPQPTKSECGRDMYVFHRAFILRFSSGKLPLLLKLLSGSKSEIDEFIAYLATIQAISNTGMETFSEHITARGNKAKYKYLRKCKNLLKPFATTPTSPGLLTFYYQTGNYMKTLEMCGHMISSSKMCLDRSDFNRVKMYEKLYCGRGYNFLQKCQAFVSDIIIPKEAPKFCPSHLHTEIKKAKQGGSIRIPPLHYAVFLSFLCYHELGDTRRRDKSLIDLRYLTSEVSSRPRKWIVHNLLGMCYEMVGDARSAIREYTESLQSKGLDQHQNAAKERIERLQHSRI
ncbi:uncharacterized protein LOC110458757 [Mizuhopecten yessoensis]|uniref:Protein mab-21 n=1 Tax=Mizuhopecten yessoensis TaxID=6573 RepID=A0A210Q5Y5_MIZYE|nr:uncharacterized protein LOC110458757 [Mizuhopecten yessoensis]OWF44156.1 Protein mab-21 [Mizuhopecten yessoensis]